MPIQPGQTLSHYRLVEKIGEGGMGVVWKAVDTTLDREVAVKLLPGAFSQDPERLRRFKREAKAVAALNHPNIVTIHSVEEAEGVHFITMELVGGRPLSRLIPRDGFPLDRFFALAAPLTDAISAAHQQGITHRDLKPENVMVTDEGRLKVLDFGLAKLAEGAPVGVSESQLPTASATEPGRILGTVAYMSPEQAQGKQVDQRSDIFSLGVVLYEMATGRRPFQGETHADLLASILRDTPPTVVELNPALPRHLGRIVAHCLARDPKRRFQTALDLRNELEALNEELALAGAPRRRGADIPEDLHSVAVLPLENLSGDSTQDFFADGMTEALITDLAKIGALKVISRTSVMQYKGVKKPLKEIARELGVGAIVEGSVLRAADRVRITAQLIEASTDKHLWAESYNRELSDVLTLQSEVARAIAREVKVKLTPEDRERLAGVRPVDPVAHDAYLKGRFCWNRRTGDALRQGIEHFNRAFEQDPTYAMGYVGLADSYLMLERYSVQPPKEVMPKAKAAAMRALEIDERIGEAHASLAMVRYYFDWDWPAAEESFRRSIELKPGYATAHHWFAWYLAGMGRDDEAIARFAQALELDPLSLIIQTNIGTHNYFARRLDRAIEQLRKTIELDRNFVVAHQWLGRALELQGLYEEAISHLRTALALSPEDNESAASLAHAYGLAGRHAEAREILAQLENRKETSYVPPYWIAVVCLGLGLHDETLHHLERAYEDRFDWLTDLGVEPMFDPLRPDPRFQDLLHRIGLSTE